MAIGNVRVNHTQLKEICVNVMPTGIPIMVVGDPGVGKSELGMSLPDEFTKRTGKKFNLCVFNASHHEPTDVGGIPFVKDERMKMAVSNLWPKEPYNVIVVEEVTKGPALIQNALGQLIHDKCIGEYVLPEQTYFYLSWNRTTNFAGDTKVLSHFVNRGMLLDLWVDPEEVIRYGYRNTWDARLVAFLNQFKHMVYDEKAFKPGEAKYNQEKPSFASPRSWAKVSKILGLNMNEDLKIASLCGLVGEGPTREYIAFEQLMNDLIPVELCIKNPKTAPLPKDMAVMYAQALSISYATKKENINPVIEYIKRMRKEYQILWLQSLSQRNPEVITACDSTILKYMTSISDLVL